MKNLVLMLAFTFSVVAFAGVKVGVVNIQKVLESVKAGKAGAASLKKSFESKQKKLQSHKEEIEKFQKSVQKQSSLLSKKALVKRENELRAKIQAFQQKTAQYQKEIQKQEQNLKSPLIKKLTPIIQSVSKEQGVDLTFERRASAVVFAKKEIDITDAVIKAFDKKHK